MTKVPVNIFWFRRDLRIADNKGLFHALQQPHPVIPIFIFDTHITGKLPPDDARIEFIYRSLESIQLQLHAIGRSLWVFKGAPLEILTKLAEEHSIDTVFTNGDHEPYGIQRDAEAASMLSEKGIRLHLSLDHLLFHKDEVLKNDGTPYQVFTPYSRRCKEIITQNHLAFYDTEKHLDRISGMAAPAFPSFTSMGFKVSGIAFPSMQLSTGLLAGYHDTRDFPAQKGTSRLGVHLRFGTISLRRLAREAMQNNETFFNELLWREFYAMILWHYPQVVHKSFKPAYDHIPWRNNEEDFERWKAGKTGYPMVDAGMRELKATGYMHNRVRMITASFLTKHLLVDWRWGEARFAEKLLDFELSSNNGGWQWSAGTGCDAAPYFRIFNPTEQHKKFDPRSEYIKRWIPELNTPKYPTPMVEHTFARKRCLETYKSALDA